MIIHLRLWLCLGIVAGLCGVLLLAPPRVAPPRTDRAVGAVPVYALLTANGFDTLGYLYHALSLNGDVQVLFDERRADEYNLFNVRYVVAPFDHQLPPFVRPIGDFGRHRLYQVETTGYFDVVDAPLAFVGGKAAWYPAASAWLKSALPQQKVYPIVSLSGANGALSTATPLSEAGALIAQQVITPRPAPGRILAESVEPHLYQATVALDRAGVVMLKSTYHPNWRAFVDGVEVRPAMLMPSYLGVSVEPGQHQIRLEYQPQPLRGDLIIVGLLLLALMGTTEWPREWLARPARRLRLDRLLPVSRQVARTLLIRAPALESLIHTLQARTASSRQFAAAALASGRRRMSTWTALPARLGWLRPHLPFIGGVTLLALLAGLPLFQLKVMYGHDALGYLPRTIEFHRALTFG